MNKFQLCFQQSLLTWSVWVWLADVRWLSNVSFISFLWFSFSLIRPTRIGGQDFPVQLLCLVLVLLGGLSGLQHLQSRFAHSPASNILKYSYLWDWLSTYLKDISWIEDLQRRLLFTPVQWYWKVRIWKLAEISEPVPQSQLLDFCWDFVVGTQAYSSIVIVIKFGNAHKRRMFVFCVRDSAGTTSCNII